jgi:hypothetical protein
MWTDIALLEAAMTDTTLGDLIATMYEEFLALYGDRELASLATATLINDMLSDEPTAAGQEDVAA